MKTVSTKHYWRLVALVSLLGLGFTALGFRLVQLQWWRHEDLLSRAQQNTQRTVLREPRRGDIKDRQGNLLATSLFVKTVCADPTLIVTNQAEVARAIAPILHVNEKDLFERLQIRTRVNADGKVVTNRYVVIKRKVHEEEWTQVKLAMEKLALPVNTNHLTKAERRFYQDLRTKSVFADPYEDQMRAYPNDRLASHVLGFVGMSEIETSKGKVLTTGGKYGVEATFNQYLSGVSGWRQTETDRRKQELVAFREQDVAPRPGLNVVLSLDAGLQTIVESELQTAMQAKSPLSISAIMVRPRTGEILALASMPNFDPNVPAGVPIDHLRNRVIADLAEPGSTFKIVVVAGALSDGLVNIQDRYDCEHGRFYYAGRMLKDDHAYGILSVEGIITKSSNIGSAKIGIKMGPERLYNHMREFGFGQRTGIPLGGEVNGIVHPTNRWSKLSISRIPMGHEVAVTSLQMVMAMSAIANEGKLMRPMLVDRLEDEQGNVVAQYHPQMVRQVVTTNAARDMVQALKTVVSQDGTAKKAIMEHYTVAGKTGTAQKPGPNGYMPGKYFSSFIGFFPADNPEICISVVLDEPKNGYYGGDTAAPVFHAIAERAANYLNIRPNLPAGELAPHQSVTGRVNTAQMRSN